MFEFGKNFFFFLFAFSVVFYIFLFFLQQEKFKLLVHVFLIFNLMKQNHATSHCDETQFSASTIITDLSRYVVFFFPYG